MENIKFNLPKWEELPDIELYMDQLIGYLEKKLAFIPLGEDEKLVTSTMINNYVKKKIILPPEKKKYNKIHLSYLIIIITLKKVFSISQISALIENMTTKSGIDEAYDSFCTEMENACILVFNNKKNIDENSCDTALKAASFAYAYKMYAQILL